MPKRWAKHGLACVADIKTFEQRPVLSSLLYYADLWDRGVAAAAAAMPKAAVEFNLDRPHFRQLAVKWEENIKFYGTKTGEGFASMAVSDLRVFKLMPISWKIISKKDLRCPLGVSRRRGEIVLTFLLQRNALGNTRWITRRWQPYQNYDLKCITLVFHMDRESMKTSSMLSCCLCLEQSPPPSLS